MASDSAKSSLLVDCFYKNKHFRYCFFNEIFSKWIDFFTNLSEYLDVIKKIILLSTLITLTACSSSKQSNVTPVINHSKTSFISLSPIASTTNQCVDNFAFIKNQKNPSYSSLSEKYIKINDGYNFLKKNQYIMGADARNVLSMNLDMKLDALCNKVSYEAYKTIGLKLRQIENI